MILNKKKKLRIIIGSLNVGGTEKQLIKIVNALSKKNWKIEIITLQEKGILNKYLNKKIVSNNLNIKSSFKLIKLIKITYKLVKIFKKNPSTLTHFFLPQAYIIGMISSIISQAKCKLIMSRRSLNLYQNKNFLYKTIERLLHKKVNKILVNSNVIRKQLINEEKVNKNKIKLIYNGVSVNNKKIKKKNNFNIVIIANLIPYKNHRILLKSLELIKDKLPKNWKLYCIGRDDGIKKELIKLSNQLSISKNIIWVETLKLKNILSNCKIGILCSKEEGFPNAILEYFASKLPVITSNVGGCKEIVKNKKNGLIIEKNNSVKLSKAIFYLYKNEKIAKKFGIEGYNNVASKYTLEKTINKHEKEYLNCLKP